MQTNFGTKLAALRYGKSRSLEEYTLIAFPIWVGCFNYPGGQLLQTQFWDTAPATGPVDSWTVHGLWYVQTGSSIFDYLLTYLQARSL
jgi:hypothetical protein